MKKKGMLLFFIALVNLLIILTIVAYALEYTSPLPKAPGNISHQAEDVERSGADVKQEVMQVDQKDITPTDYNGSTHPYNTWNNPYTRGVDGYNYTDPQDYVDTSTP